MQNKKEYISNEKPLEHAVTRAYAKVAKMLTDIGHSIDFIACQCSNNTQSIHRLGVPSP